MTDGRKILFLELNEVNFEYLEFYAKRGHLPNFARLFNDVGYATTTSESRYEELEPWIQWVTAHSGRTLADHKIFRLGDGVHGSHPQIWDELSERGLVVGAISPMNGACRSPKLAFFVPDPWTRTGVIARPFVRRMYEAIAQAVSENATARTTVRSLTNLASGAIRIARPRSYGKYLGLIARARRRPWSKAIFLDRLLADLLVDEVRRAQPHFALLFLNAAAHIQHHYLFSSQAYAGSMRNPDWYVAPGTDPLLDVYKAYDDIVGSLRAAFPDRRLMIATALHQDPHPDATFYWRLRDHAAFLTRLGARFDQIEPLMSRDFLVKCRSESEAAETALLLQQATDESGAALFDVDNRGSDLFVMLTYSDEIRPTTRVRLGARDCGSLEGEVAFVALKNGRHNGIGYFLDAGRRQSPDVDRFALTEIPTRIHEALSLPHAV